MRLTGQQVQTHFNNRRKRVMTPDIIEKRYREKTGTGREEKLEKLIHEARETFNEQDRDIYRYYSGTAAYKKDCILETFKGPHIEKQEETLKDLDKEVQDDEDEAILIKEPDQSKEGIIRIGKTVEMEKNRASDREVEVDEELFNSDDEVRLPKRHSVSAAEIRQLQKEMLKSEKRLFDTWTHMVVVHMSGIRELITSQRIILEEMMAFFKRCSTPGRPAEATMGEECVVICDPNIEPSLREGTIISTIV
ncbi:hypothetical protein TELCIR_14194 [Teladorsagia circumcincta]|uniref:Uncharacterized protein n=1 Tax=Teladorsagia circumcincta TaxID=45464 RepID=A0A2G9U1R1_TELCI|nr:hypothetical protein TELCIR_14194 [Teladorsagia circumcincta]